MSEARCQRNSTWSDSDARASGKVRCCRARPVRTRDVESVGFRAERQPLSGRSVMSRSLSVGLLSCAALLLVAAPSRAGTIKVPSQFDTIQAGIDNAADGDTVQVSKGVYN